MSTAKGKAGEDNETAGGGEEDYADAVTRHAKYLGIDPVRDAAYVWIAEEALNADVPEGWVTGEGEGEYEGLVYYYNEASGESTWDHPLDDFYREKFEKKKAKHAERKKRDRGDKYTSKSRSSSSPSKGSRGTNRRQTSDDEKNIDDRSNSKRKSSKQSTRHDKHGSSERVDRREYDSQGSRYRSASRNRHRKEHQTARDSVEDSRHRSRSRRHGREDDSRMGADDRESWRRHRSTSDRGRRESDSDRGRGPKEKYENRRQEGGRRSTGHGRDNKSSREPRRSRSTDEVLDSGDHERDRKSKRTATSKQTETLVRSSRGRNDFTRDVDGGTSVPLDGGEKRERSNLEARDQPGLEIVAQHSLDHKCPTHNSSGLSETSVSGQEGIGLSPSDTQDLRERRGSQSRGREHSAGNDADRNRESFDADRAGLRRESGQQGLSQQQENNDPRSTDFVTLSEDPPVGGDTWRTKSVKGNCSGERSDSLNARRTTFKEPGFDTGTNARGDWPSGGDSDVDKDEQGNPLADKAAAPIGKTIELEEAFGGEVSREDSAVPGRGATGAGQTSDEMRVKRMTGTLLNDNDLEEVDFDDELRDIEDESDKNSLPDKKEETSSKVNPPSKRPTDVERSDNTGATASFISPKPAGPANAVAQGQRRPYREEHPGEASPRKSDNQTRAVIVGNRNIEHEKKDRHHYSSEEDREGVGVGSNISALVTSAFGISDRNQDEWPEVTEELVGGVKRREKRADSDRGSSETMRGDRGGARGRSRENRMEADGVSRDDAGRHDLHGDSSDHKRRVDQHNRSRDRRAERSSGQPTFHLEGQKGSDRSPGMAPAHRDRAGAYDGRLDESATKIRAGGGHGTPGMSNGLSDDESSFISRNGRGREPRNYDSRGGGYSSYNHHPQCGWNGGGTTTVGHRADLNDGHQYLAGAGVENRNMERQLLQQQQEASTKTRELETKVVRLEAGLASSTSREDHLREELAEAARREGATREKHARALAEEEKKVASLNDKLSDAASKAKEAAKAEDAYSKSEQNLRLELKSNQEKLKTLEAVLARKEEEEKASVREASDAPNLRLVLATREEEAERQGKVLVDVQGRLAEATNKVAELSMEVRRTKDVAERVRLEAAESSSRASTSEAALSQAASEMSALNHALSRAREEVSSKESEAVKTAEETNRLRLQLGLEREKSSNTEDRLLRAKTAVESEAESLRARTAELQSANASMEREMRNSQQESLSRLRESERERDAALYEGKRSAELASSAEAWRLKETLRADAAADRALTTGTEVAELRSEAARLRTSMDAAVAPYAKRNAELQGQLDEARREAAGLTAEADRLKAVHAAEMAALKEEVSRKLPSIAEKAASEAGRHWRKRAEQETATLRAERDSRLRELQVAISECEARRQKDVAGARFEAERFRSVAEKLAAENRNIRGELERYLAREAAPSVAGLRSSVKGGRAVGSTAGSSSQTFGIGGGTGREGGHGELADAKTREGVLQAKVLGDVEAHLNVLRAQLKQGTPGVTSTADDVPFERMAGAAHSSPMGAPQRPGDPVAGAAGRLAPTGAVADAEDIIASATMGSAPPSMESRGNFHVSPTPEQRSDNGLTEMEDMRLTRLLRSSASSSSPPSVLAPSELIAPMVGQQRVKANNESSSIASPGGVNRNINGGSFRKGTSEPSASTMADDDGGKEDRYFPEGILSSENGGVVRDLFGHSPEGDNEGFGREGQARRSGKALARGGYVARGVESLACEDEDDLEDISDGGFHSGCWRRKYVRGDMR